jgi:NADPH:quinone reductase-like Zn-dependent oxidoreductase
MGNRALIDELMEMLGSRRLHPSAPVGYPLEEAATVMGGLIDRSISGKAVLVP